MVDNVTTYRERFQTKEDAKSSCEAFHAQKVVTVGRDGNNIYHLLLFASIASELIEGSSVHYKFSTNSPIRHPSYFYLDSFCHDVIHFHTELEAEIIELLVGIGATDSSKQMVTNKSDVGHL